MVYNAETGRKGVAHPTENDNGHGKAIEDFANVVLPSMMRKRLPSSAPCVEPSGLLHLLHR